MYYVVQLIIRYTTYFDTLINNETAETHTKSIRLKSKDEEVGPYL